MSRPSDPHAKIDLLRAAEAVFAQHGLEHAKVEEIAARAGRSKGAFYLHFASKEDAFRQIVETMLARLGACIDEGILADEGEAEVDPQQALLRWAEKDLEVFEFVWQNRKLVRLLLEGGGGAAFGHLIEEFAERSQQQTIRVLERGVRLARYRADLDVRLASLLIAGAYDRVARAMVKSELKPDLRATVAGIQRLLLPGLLDPAQARLLTDIIDSAVRNRRPAPATRKEIGEQIVPGGISGSRSGGKPEPRARVTPAARAAKATRTARTTQTRKTPQTRKSTPPRRSR